MLFVVVNCRGNKQFVQLKWWETMVSKCGNKLHKYSLHCPRVAFWVDHIVLVLFMKYWTLKSGPFQCKMWPVLLKYQQLLRCVQLLNKVTQVYTVWSNWWHHYFLWQKKLKPKKRKLNLTSYYKNTLGHATNRDSPTAHVHTSLIDEKRSRTLTLPPTAANC